MPYFDMAAIVTRLPRQQCRSGKALTQSGTDYVGFCGLSAGNVTFHFTGPYINLAVLMIIMLCYVGRVCLEPVLCDRPESPLTFFNGGPYV